MSEERMSKVWYVHWITENGMGDLWGKVGGCFWSSEELALECLRRARADPDYADCHLSLRGCDVDVSHEAVYKDIAP